MERKGIFRANPTFLEKGAELYNRPSSFDEFFGQGKVVKKLKVFIEASKIRDEVLDHVLLSGPPGLGKTTLAYLIAKELGVGIKVLSGPALERPGDLASILTNLTPREVLFIDEIHRLNISVEEMLYSAMEDFRLDIIIGKGASARTVKINVQPFTLIGATTLEGKVSKPLRNRFGVPLRLEYYTEKELIKIISHFAQKLGFKIKNDAAKILSVASRGTPRIAIRIFRRIRDFASVKHTNVITKEIACEGLEALEIDLKGLDRIDRQILKTMLEEFNGGPVSLDTIAAIIGENSDTIYEVYEPFLIKNGFLRRTPRGRMVTRKAAAHLGLKLKKTVEDDVENQNKLFGE
jgi:Holliday junction DNA helicase RuvB